MGSHRPKQNPQKGAPKDKAPAEKAELQKAQPTYDIKFNGAKWDQVIDWFKDISGLTFIGPNMPTGTVSIVSPLVDGKPRRYTVGQLVDVLNEHLISEKWLLVRKEYSFLIHPADVPLPLESVRLITLDYLTKGDLAKSEYVRVTYQLQSLQAETFAPGVQKMMSPFGRVIPLEEPNQLILLENVGNLRIIVDTIKGIDGNEGGQGQPMVWECKYCRAGVAARKTPRFAGRP